MNWSKKALAARRHMANAEAADVEGEENVIKSSSDDDGLHYISDSQRKAFCGTTACGKLGFSLDMGDGEGATDDAIDVTCEECKAALHRQMAKRECRRLCREGFNPPRGVLR